MILRISVLVALALAACATAIAPAALGAGSDAAATRDYLAANLSLLRTARSHLAIEERAPREVLAETRRDCPHAGAESPQNPESTQMSDEVIGAMVLNAARPDVAAIRAFVARVDALRWSSHRAAAAVHAYTAKLRTLLALAPPHLCADVRAWAAGGYRSLPASTVSFVARFMPAWVALGYVPGALRAHQSPEQRATTASCAGIEAQISDAEARAVETWGAIMTELSLFP